MNARSLFTAIFKGKGNASTVVMDQAHTFKFKLNKTLQPVVLHVPAARECPTEFEQPPDKEYFDSEAGLSTEQIRLLDSLPLGTTTVHYRRSAEAGLLPRVREDHWALRAGQRAGRAAHR